MSFGTYVNIDLYFSHETYKDKCEVEWDLKEVRDTLRDIETKIAMYTASAPKDSLYTKDCEGHEMNPVDVMYYELRKLKEWYKEEVINEWKLERLLENWDSRTGDYIDQEKIKKELEHNQ